MSANVNPPPKRVGTHRHETSGGRVSEQSGPSESLGYELRLAPEGKGQGVYATRRFLAGETVVVGVVERRISENHSHATQVGRSEFVLLGGLGSRVNHSCDPNCGIRLNTSGAPDLVALRTIVPGEEITFDYAMRNYTVEHFTGPCRCGSAMCRRVVSGWKGLPAERKAAYAGFVAPYLLAIDREERIGRDRR